MTLYINGFDAGTAGSNVTKASITSSGYAFTVGGSAVAKFTATDKIDGALAIEIARVSGSTLQLYTNAALNTGDISFSLMFTYTGALPGTNDYLFDTRTTASASLVRVLTNSTGHAFLQLAGSTKYTATTAFIVGTQYRCDVRIHVNASSGSIHCDFYSPTSSSPAFTGYAGTSLNTGTLNINDVWFGPLGSNTVASGAFVLDLLRIDDTQSTTYFGPTTAPPPTCSAGSPQTVNSRAALSLAGSVSWAVGHSGTVAWTGGSTPITAPTSLSATVADIGWPTLTAGNPIVDDVVTYTLTATQDDSQVATSTVNIARKCNNRWALKGTQFVCLPPLQGARTTSFVRFAIDGTVCPIGQLDVTLGETLPVGAAPVRNVGVRPNVTLTPHAGNLVLASGGTYSGLDISGSVTTTGTLAVPATVTDCKIRGVPGTTADAGLALGHSYDLSGTVFEWCDFDATGTESGFQNGLSGGNFTVRYSTIARVTDGVHVTGQGGAVTIEACRIYNCYYESIWNDATSSVRTTGFTDIGGKIWTPPFADQAGSGDTHCDGIQMFGSTGNPSHVIRGCYIGGANPAGRPSNDPSLDPTVPGDYAAIQLWNAALTYKNTAIILNPISGFVLTVLVELNWLHGGASVLSASTNGTDTGTGITVQNNRFIRAGSTGFIINTQTGWAGTLTSNVFDDDGSPATVHHF